MAKRIAVPKIEKASKPAVVPAVPVATSTPVRNTAIPKPVVPASPKPKVIKPITYEMISERAYFIAMSGTGSSPDENWYRAEAELKKESTL